MFKTIWNWLTRTNVSADGFENSNDLHVVVVGAWGGGFSLCSTFARKNVEFITIAAANGLITTRHADGNYGRMWYATVKGLMFLDNFYGDK